MKWSSLVKVGGWEHCVLGAALTLGSVACSGQDGAPGQTGPQGEQGQKGETGAIGETGASGEAGPKGDAGPKGAAGPKGDDGEDGLPGADGAKGDPGAKGDSGAKGESGETGPKGAPGDAGYFVLKDATGAVLGDLVTFQQGLFLVRNLQGILLSYALDDGRVLSPSGGLGDTLYFASANCSGAPLVRTTLLDAAVINDGQLYKADLPYSSSFTHHSQKSYETGDCTAATGTGAFMAATLVGTAPPQAAVPLSLE